MSGAAEPGRRDAFRALLAAPNLRRLMVANLGSTMGKYAWWVALAVWAFAEGGPGLVGALGFARVAPAVVSSLFIGPALHRVGIRGTLIATDVLRVLVLVLVAVCLIAGAPAVLVVVLIGVSGAAAAFFYPAQQALLPAVAETPEQVTAANVASSLIEGVGTFLGPALGAALLVATSPQTVILVSAGALVLSALLIARIRIEEPEPEPLEGGVLAEAASGFRVIGADRPLAVLVALIVAQCLLAGALLVLTVIIALDLLQEGQAWVGYLDGAIGVGGIVGGLFAASLVGRKRLAGPFAGSMLLWGAPFILIAALTEPAVALMGMVVVGVGNAVGDVAFMTLMHRAVPEEKLGRAFGALESMATAAMAIGGLIATGLVELSGAETALVITGLILPLATAVAWPVLQRIDAAALVPEEALAVLRQIPMLAILPPQTLETLARSATRLELGARETVFAQGDSGDRYFVIESGSVQVTIDGAPIRVQGAVSGFGEIALLHDLPRTATITAREPLVVWTLEREDFLAAVTGDPGAAGEAHRRAGVLLGYARPGLVPV